MLRKSIFSIFLTRYLRGRRQGARSRAGAEPYLAGSYGLRTTFSVSQLAPSEPAIGSSRSEPLMTGLGQQSIPGIDRMRERWSHRVPIALGGAGVHVTREVRDLGQIIELVRDERDERVA